MNIDYSRLDEELKELAQDLVQKGHHPRRDDPYMDEWADCRVEQFFPSPGTLPPPPRAPKLDEANIAVWGIFLLIGSLFAIGPLSASPSRNAGFITGAIVFWICYIALWITARALDKRYARAVKRYWATYDPHHVHRAALRSELAKRLGSAIDDAWYEFSRPIATVPAADIRDSPRSQLAWTPHGPRPSAMASCNDRQAEFLARDWMLFLGESGCRVSPATRDGGADVVSKRFVAEVKHHAAPVSPALVRQIFGVATAEGKTALFFSLSGYSAAAVEFGKQVKMALFVYDFARGTLIPKSPAAELALVKGLPSLSRYLRTPDGF
ncbi:restriction endonuclease [Arthrobacter sp. NPDC093128]|uniref:restriction endonuclease n=1 Tax=Arthrobacter sp. NPDC093128 TaxID=3154979 RepID=UPI003426F3EB